ncbi:MAG: DUF3667 domain-containing protein [Flavobacteriales bacterium]|nr:DUF3667 domain-containing protein [Flavobacteriales bacterium]
MHCKNCHTEFKGTERFCPNCGQKNIEKLNLKYILGQFVEDVFNWDSKFFTTLKYLILKPGFLSKEFIAGRRVRYVSPIRLYLVLSVLFFFLISIVGQLPKEESQGDLKAGFTYNDQKIDVAPEKYRELIASNELDYYVKDTLGFTGSFDRYMVKKTIIAENSEGEFGNTLLDQLSIFLLIFIPVISLVYKWTFSRNKYDYIKHMMFNVHYNSFIMFLLVLNELTKFFDRVGLSTFRLLFILAMILLAVGYLFKAIKRFYERKWWVVLYKMLFLAIGYLSLVIVFVILLMAVSLVITS